MFYFFLDVRADNNPPAMAIGSTRGYVIFKKKKKKKRADNKRVVIPVVYLLKHKAFVLCLCVPAVGKTLG